MPVPHSPYAPLNPDKPEPTGICDRCAFLWPLKRLNEQREWRGASLKGIGLLVCPTCMDKPQQNGFRTIVIGPDPKPLRNPRPAAALPVREQFVLDDPERDLLDDEDLELG